MRNRESSFKQQLVCLLPRIWRFGISLTGSTEVCNDLVQATCERALSRYHQWRPGTRLDHWVFKIMHSIWINELRSQAIRRGTGFVDHENYRLESTLPDQESSLFNEQIINATLALPEAQRCALLLVYVEGYSYKEAAELLDVPIGTVMSRLSRGRLGLAEKLQLQIKSRRSLESV